MSVNNRGHKRSVSQKVKDMQLSTIEAQITRAKLLLTRALKLAKAFERQKLGRRQKTANLSKEAQNGSRIVTEIQALKVRNCDYPMIKLKITIRSQDTNFLQLSLEH